MGPGFPAWEKDDGDNDDNTTTMMMTTTTTLKMTRTIMTKTKMV